MALADDLLNQAWTLAGLDKGKPKQVNLRRSISSAYYSLFHLLVSEAASRVSPARPGNLGARIGRALTHNEMKRVCGSISDNAPSAVLKELLPAGFSDRMRLVCSSFQLLQERRHSADYDTSATFTRVQAEASAGLAEDAFAAWQLIRSDDEANVFLAALLFGARWAK